MCIFKIGVSQYNSQFETFELIKNGTRISADEADNPRLDRGE